MNDESNSVNVHFMLLETELLAKKARLNSLSVNIGLQVLYLS